MTCQKCNAFFGYENVLSGTVELFCTKCKTWTILRVVEKVFETEKLDNDEKQGNNEDNSVG